MLRRYFRFLLLSLALLLFTPAHSEMSLSVSSSLDTFDYELDGIHLKLQKLSARWQLSPFEDQRLDIEQLKAKRLIITIREGKNRASGSPLPDRINLPFPIRIAQAEIAEIIIISENKQQTLQNVRFGFSADAKKLHLNLMHASTPWGDSSANLNIGTAKPFAVNGEASLKEAERKMPYDVKVRLSGDFSTLRFESDALLSTLNGKTAILQANAPVTNPIARVSAQGQLNLTGDYPLTLNAQFNQLHTALLGDYPAALLNFDLTLNGKLQPNLSASLEFAARNSQWQSEPLTASGKVMITDTRIEQIDFQAAIATNRILASGNLGKADSRLTWQAELPNLTTFGQQYGGEIHADGVIEGHFDNLAVNFNLIAQSLRLPNNLQIEKIDAQARLSAGEDGIAEGNIKASAIRYGSNQPLDGQAQLTGTRTKHALTLNTQGQNVNLASILQGGLASNHVWQGFLQQLNYTGKTPVKLSAPAPLSISSSEISLTQANLQFNTGRALIQTLQLAKNKLRSIGQLHQFTLDDLPPDLLTLPDSLHGSPVFSGKWDIDAAETLNGNLSLWRESGDFKFIASNGKETPLGLDEAKFDATFSDSQTVLSSRLNGKNLGNLDVLLSTTLSKTTDGFALMSSAPLKLKGSAELKTLSWLPLPTNLMDADIDGQFNLTIAANGTFDEPHLSGNLTGQNLYFSLPSRGVTLTDGILQAEFLNNALFIKKASWQGIKGNVNADGTWLLGSGKPSLDLNWSANQFTLLSRTDRLLTFTGKGNTTLLGDMLTIAGKVNVDKGLIELAEEDLPMLDDDVVVLGAATPAKQPSLQILLNNFQIDLADDFILRGRGLDAKLKGSLSLTGLTQHRPHTIGSIQVEKGTFMAYGQVLNIERGIFNFSGTIDNPGLNIRAMRNSKPVNAGVEITGTAFVPITKLVSDPNVAETEKLSWLILGHGMDTAGKNDYGMLSLAAGVLLSQGQSVPLQTQLARAAGLDEFSFAGGDAESASLTFGKRLTSQLYLSYEKSMTGLLDVARLTFNITNRWSLRAEAGAESAVDVLYTFSFK